MAQLDYQAREALEELGFTVAGRTAERTGKIQINVMPDQNGADGARYLVQIVLPNGRMLMCATSLERLLEASE